MPDRFLFWQTFVPAPDIEAVVRLLKSGTSSYTLPDRSGYRPFKSIYKEPVVMSYRLAAIAFLAFLFCVSTFAQDRRPQPEQSSEEAQSQDDETIKVDTNLVVVPVIASDRNDLYVHDLKKEEFKVSDDGVPQEIAFFATTTAPFHVVLMIDTSASTQQKLGQIQRAAINFTEQLQDQDRVKVISFDDAIRDLCEFTSDRALLGEAINKTRAGKGTKLYDAFTLAVNSLHPVKGRKAIVLFSDGVDYHSDRSGFDDNRKAIQESGIIVYTIRFDTRQETERIVRTAQQQSGGAPVDLATVLGAPPQGRTPSTFPGGGSQPAPTSAPQSVLRIPLPQLPNRRQQIPPTGPNDPDSRFPDTTGGRPLPEYPDRSRPNDYPSQRLPREDDGVSGMLDNLYRTADDYLDAMAVESGGQMMRADTLGELPDAFANIALQLRTQYSLGFYPTSGTKDGKYHKLKVSTTRKDIVVRARPGYRVAGGAKRAE
jgi:VWFA-related protein